MKFITEMELRDLYKIEPFTTYILEPDIKITPGARQFLVDRRVKLVKDDKSNQEQVENWRTLRLRRSMDCIESLFLLIGAEILHAGDVNLSEEVMILGKFFRNIRKVEQEQIDSEITNFWGLTEEEFTKQYNNLEKNVEINEFHVNFKNGREIALLNHLRSSLREVELVILETYWNDEKQICSRQGLVDSVNLIIKILCMIMWKSLGGEKCKR